MASTSFEYALYQLLCVYTIMNVTLHVLINVCVSVLVDLKCTTLLDMCVFKLLWHTVNYLLFN